MRYLGILLPLIVRLISFAVGITRKIQTNQTLDPDQQQAEPESAESISTYLPKAEPGLGSLLVKENQSLNNVSPKTTNSVLQNTSSSTKDSFPRPHHSSPLGRANKRGQLLDKYTGLKKAIIMSELLHSKIF